MQGEKSQTGLLKDRKKERKKQQHKQNKPKISSSSSRPDCFDYTVQHGNYNVPLRSDKCLPIHCRSTTISLETT